MMPGTTAIFGLVLICQIACSQATGSLRALSKTQGSRQNAPCILVQRLVQQKDGTGYAEWACQMDSADAASSGIFFATVEGLTEDIVAGELRSGVTTLIAEGAKINGESLIIPAGAKVTIGSTSDSSSSNTTSADAMDRTPFGSKDVLVIRVLAQDRKVWASTAELADDIFGLGDVDQVNMRKQFVACSHGQIRMLPFSGTTPTGMEITNGVTEISIAETVNGKGFKKIENAAVAQATEILGDLKSQFHYVMLCLPPGTMGSWIAFAYANHWLSIYNNQWCGRVSTQMHEIGHNLGLAHSGVGDDPYGDKSGWMGLSYIDDDWPVMCFNPAKSWQLGWYDSQQIKWNPQAQGQYSGIMVGVVDYGNFGTSKDHHVIVKLQKDFLNDLYIGYNRMKRINWATQASQNKIVVVEQGEGFSESTLQAELSKGDTYRIENYMLSGRNLIIQFTDVSEDLDEASLDIFFDDCVPPECSE
jgi:hypothetical protein